MFGKLDIEMQLKRARSQHRRAEDLVLAEARQILRKDLFSEEKVLQNLQQYNRSFEVVNEEDIEPARVFTPHEIRDVAVRYRLKFLESRFYKAEFPYEAILQIKELNRRHGKDLKVFRVMAAPELFTGKLPSSECSLFVKTNYDNYYLLHRWGTAVSRNRRWFYWPLRRFENLALTILLFTLCLTLSLPTSTITLDSQAEYWSGYRIAAFFHLLIFDTAVTVYFAFAFALNFSASIWNRPQDFD